jgi:hypothetical protein
MDDHMNLPYEQFFNILGGLSITVRLAGERSLWLDLYGWRLFTVKAGSL